MSDVRAELGKLQASERKARRIWMTRAPPADIYVLYPGQGSERHLSSSFFIRIEGAEQAEHRGVPPGIRQGFGAGGIEPAAGEGDGADVGVAACGDRDGVSALGGAGIS